MLTYSTGIFEIRISDGLLEVRIEGVRTPQMNGEADRAINSLFNAALVSAVAFDIRASDYALSPVELESRVRQIGRQCCGIPLAFIGRDNQQGQIRRAVNAIEAIHGIARGFRCRRQAYAWLKRTRQPA